MWENFRFETWFLVCLSHCALHTDQGQIQDLVQEGWTPKGSREHKMHVKLTNIWLWAGNSSNLPCPLELSFPASRKLLPCFSPAPEMPRLELIWRQGQDTRHNLQGCASASQTDTNTWFFVGMCMKKKWQFRLHGGQVGQTRRMSKYL